MLSKLLIKYLPFKIKNYFISIGKNEVIKSLEYGNVSYSQEGEDLIIERYIGNKNDGFYLDIGAHHPKRFSNTYRFYKKGWRGVNIDAMPGSMIVFKKERPLDVNLEIGVSKTEGELNFYIFNEPALNTFSENEAKAKDGLQDYKIVSIEKIKTLPLSKILGENINEGKIIDFMTIDVEGFDLQVLESNNWEKYRPKLLLVEDLRRESLMDLSSKSEVYNFLTKLEYELVSKTMNTLFFKDVLGA